MHKKTTRELCRFRLLLGSREGQRLFEYFDTIACACVVELWNESGSGGMECGWSSSAGLNELAKQRGSAAAWEPECERWRGERERESGFEREREREGERARVRERARARARERESERARERERAPERERERKSLAGQARPGA
eukprot:379924-Pleurochrysis_carterae.AAC.1